VTEIVFTAIINGHHDMPLHKTIISKRHRHTEATISDLLPASVQVFLPRNLFPAQDSGKTQVREEDVKREEKGERENECRVSPHDSSTRRRRRRSETRDMRGKGTSSKEIEGDENLFLKDQRDRKTE
jgi:hypothetical protein